MFDQLNTETLDQPQVIETVQDLPAQDQQNQDIDLAENLYFGDRSVNIRTPNELAEADLEQEPELRGSFAMIKEEPNTSPSKHSRLRKIKKLPTLEANEKILQFLKERDTKQNIKDHAAGMKLMSTEQHKANNARGAILAKKEKEEHKITRIFSAEFEDKLAFQERRKQLEMKQEDETFETTPELFIKPDLLMTKYLTNGKINPRVDSGIQDSMLERLKIAMHQICKE